MTRDSPRGARYQRYKMNDVRPVVENCWWPATIVSLLLAALWFDHSGMGRFHASYDSGVYLESARMMQRGYPQYSVVFGSQPPLWLPLLRASFFLFGESFFAGQLVSAAASLITVAAVIAIVAQLQDRLSATIAALLIVFAPVELAWCRSVIADVPSSAFSTLAIALVVRYFSAGCRVWLVLTAVAIAVSVLIKLSGVYTLPSVLLLVLARWMQEPRFDRSARVYGFCQDVLILGTMVAGLVVLAASAFGLPEVWDQAVLFHLKARVSAHAEETSGIIFNCWPSNGPLQILIALSAVCIFGGWRGAAPLAWVFCALFGLLQQRPLFTHHLLAVIPAFATAAACGWGEIKRRALNYRNRRENMPLRQVSSIARAACLIVGFVVPAQLWATARMNDYFELAAQTERTPMDLAIADELQQLTRPDDSILTDAQGIAFLAHRNVPPGLTDTSFRRIAAGYLSEQQAIEEIKRTHVRAALLWTGRLAQMPAVVAWVRTHLPQHYDFGNGRELYFLPQTEKCQRVD